MIALKQLNALFLLNLIFLFIVIHFCQLFSYNSMHVLQRTSLIFKSMAVEPSIPWVLGMTMGA